MTFTLKVKSKKKLAEEAQQNQQPGAEQTVTETTAEEKTAPAATTPASPKLFRKMLIKLRNQLLKNKLTLITRL